MAFHNVPPNGFPDIPDIEDLEAVQGEIDQLKSGLTNVDVALNVPEGTGKNLLAIPDGEYSPSGITYTVNNTAIQVVGTATANSYYTFYSWNKLKNTFLASYAGKKLKISNTSDDVRFTLAYRKDSSSTSSEYNVFNGEAELTLPSDTTYEIYLAFRVLSGVSVNTVIYPMIRPASVSDATFAAYIPSVDSRIEAVERKLTVAYYDTDDITTGADGAFNILSTNLGQIISVRSFGSHAIVSVSMAGNNNYFISYNVSTMTPEASTNIGKVRVYYAV